MYANRGKLAWQAVNRIELSPKYGSSFMGKNSVNVLLLKIAKNLESYFIINPIFTRKRREARSEMRDSFFEK